MTTMQYYKTHRRRS